MKNTIKKSVAIALVSILIFVASLTWLPTFAVIPTDVPTECFLSLRPNPIGLGQELLVNGWRVPAPYMYQTLGLTDPLPPEALSPTDGVHFDFRLIITKPDGEILDLYPIESDGPGSMWITYMIDQIGTWTFQLIWEGDEYFLSSDVTEKLVVQEDPIPSYPESEIPTDEPWDYPIDYEKRTWSQISGGWYQAKYDESATNYNPYSNAPRSAHVLWTLEPVSGIAGLIGGEYGTDDYYSATSYSINVVMAGRGYSSAGGNITCIDIRTGEVLWSVPGSFHVGSIRGRSPVLYEFSRSGRFRIYDALTGEVELDVEGMYPLGGSQGLGIGFQDPYVYSSQRIGDQEYLIKWTTEGNSDDFAERVVLNVTSVFEPEYPHNQSLQTYAITWNEDVLFQLGWPYYAESGAMNTTTGEELWTYTLTPDIAWITSRGAVGIYQGLAICPIVLPQARSIAAWNITTGEIEWISEQAAYPWGAFWGYQFAAAYGMVYKTTYAGLYSYNITNGEIVWYYSPGEAGMETPYAIQRAGESGLEYPHTTWPLFSIAVVADGVIFIPTGEHTPTSPYLRGQKLHAVNAWTGEKLWDIRGYFTVTAIAEGNLFATNTYDGRAYSFAKGETETTISVSNEAISKGSSVLLKGTVLDMSPAQPGTAAISDASMSDWMEYLHMQEPMPMDATGVSVTLDAIDPNGNFVNIGTVTSNTDGKYALSWTPEHEGMYQVLASFEGSESYYCSHDTTYIAVGPAPSPSQQLESELAGPTQAAEAPFIATDVIVILAAVIFAVIALAGFFILRKRR
jgi:hypothetical protein